MRDIDTYRTAPDTDGGGDPPPNDPGGTGHSPTQPGPDDDEGEGDDEQ